MQNQEFTNPLSGEQSPYLLQHAHNPVFWYPWGETALNKAIEEDKPILLSIGYSTCHWCHVMAHESFENEEIAKQINAHFIAIKVDREERLDIDQVYMTAVTAMGMQGGWPLTVFLTPKGEPFFGGTYFPPVAKWGSPGFINVLQSIADSWKNDRAHVINSAQSITQMLQRHVEEKPSGDAIDLNVIQKTIHQFSTRFDEHWGGFNPAPKFPMPHVLSFLLRAAHDQKDQEGILGMVEQTLGCIAKGGIWDHLGFGVHRYSTDQEWHVPHFEKMLYDQALMAQAFLEAYQVTGDYLYAQKAKEIFIYVLRDLRDPQGGFYSAQDADSLNEHGHMSEGAFYVWGFKEIEELLGSSRAEIFNFMYGVQEAGNVQADPHGEFIQKNILFEQNSIKQAALEFSLPEAEIAHVIEQSRNILMSHRQQRPQPHLDDKVLTDWNGLMIDALAFGGRVLNDEILIKASKDAADFILTHLWKDGRLLHRWRGNQAHISGTLDDYAFFGLALLSVYQSTNDQKYLDKAITIADVMKDLFLDKNQGGFFLTAHDADKLIFRPKEAYDGALPSGNSVAARFLLSLGTITHEQHYSEILEGVLKAFSPSVERSPGSYAFLLSVFRDYAKGPIEIMLKGPSPSDATIAKMMKVVYKHFIPGHFISFKVNPKVEALMCAKGRCLPPVFNEVELERILLL